MEMGISSGMMLMGLPWTGRVLALRRCKEGGSMGLLLLSEVLRAVRLFAAVVAARREREARERFEDMFLMDVGVMGGVLACATPMVERELCGDSDGL